MIMAMLSPSEKLKRLYTDLIRGRSRVRIVKAEPVLLNYPPIFLIGPLRSGTTLMRYIVDSHSRLCCPPETNYIGVLKGLLTDEKSRIGLQSMGYDDAHVISKIREFCIYFYGNYALSKQKPRWADKSTSYVDHLNFIERLFPEAQFIMIYRHGLDQSHSLSRGGTTIDKAAMAYQRQPEEDPRLSAIRYWVDKTQQMLNFEKLFPEKCIRIRYEDLCGNPKERLIPIFDFLQESWDPNVLEFYNFEHDMGPEHGRTITTRGFKVSKNNYLTWPHEIINECFSIANPLLDELGYSTNTL